MKCFVIPLTALAFVAGGTTARAASSVDLGLTGKITPSACEPSLSNGGTYELGKIPAKELNLDKPTPLPEQNLQLTITCQALTLAAFKPSDNRPGSNPEGDLSPSFGLGLVNSNEKIGSMWLRLGSIMADGVQMYGITSVGTSSWSHSNILSPAFLTSFARDRTTHPLAPAPIQRLTADLLMTARIAPANTLTLTHEVPIDGSVTLEINYL